MAVPKRRSSNSRTNRRRAHHFLVAKELTVCSKCSTPIPAHVACPKCGRYMGRAMVEMQEKKTKAKGGDKK